MIKIRHRGNFANLERFLSRAQRLQIRSILERYGAEGVAALASATPVDTGLTSRSWDYQIDIRSKGYTLTWTNSNIIKGVPIAIILQYGHGTGTGGYVAGRDYINPAIRPIFDKISDSIGKEVAKL